MRMDEQDFDQTCEMCGEISDELNEYPDCDRSVGYHGSVVACPSCAEGYKNHCGSCA